MVLVALESLAEGAAAQRADLRLELLLVDVVAVTPLQGSGLGCAIPAEPDLSRLRGVAAGGQCVSDAPCLHRALNRGPGCGSQMGC